MKTAPRDVKLLRRQIDRIDERLVALLNRRMRIALRIGGAKKRAGAPVHDPAREREVLRKVTRLNKGPLTAGALRDVYRRIVSTCRKGESSAYADRPAS